MPDAKTPRDLSNAFGFPSWGYWGQRPGTVRGGPWDGLEPYILNLDSPLRSHHSPRANGY